MAQKALDPNSLTANAQNQLQATISGQYLNPGTNPAFGQYMNDALGQVRSQFAGQYGGLAGGNLTNSGYQEGLVRALGNVALPAYSNLYNTERANQLNATQLAPGMDYANLAQLSQVGSAQDTRAQLEAMAKQQEYMSPWNNLANYLKALQVNAGGTENKQVPFFTNPLANMLGLGLFGMQGYKMFGGGGGAGAAGVGGAAAAGAASGVGEGLVADAAWGALLV